MTGASVNFLIFFEKKDERLFRFGDIPPKLLFS